MDAHGIRILEYDKIKALLAKHAVTAIGRELAMSLEPMRSPDFVRRALAETTEMRRVLDVLQAPPLDPLIDVRPLLEKASPEGMLLEPNELLAILSALIVSRKTKAFFKGITLDVPLLKGMAAALHSFDTLESEIDKVVDEKAQVRDTASRDLLRIRKHLRHERADLTRNIEKLMRSPDIGRILQERFFTIREGRFVLPIQSKFKARIRGIIHDVSDTGETVFLEPIQFVEQGNRIRNLEVEEEREVRRVLIQATSLVRHDLTEIRVAIDILGHVDLTLAKARYGLAARMEEPRITADNRLRIERGRHPILIDRIGDKVVPLDLVIGENENALVVTGPNTGGKTVVLKTVGAILLMAWSGMHVPAEGETELPLLEDIYADIGDEQSLEQSLSTFSSHMTQIRNIVVAARPGTLVLLDELGAGTDPVEGGALGRAILTELKKRGCLVMVTTHLADIKLFAHLAEGIANGAMEFDEESFQPTYRLRMGSTGSSNALRIAEKLGMPREIVECARGLLNVDSDEATVMLRKLEEALADAARYERHRREELEKVRALREELQKKQSKVEKDRQEVLNRTRLEARAELEKLRKQIRGTEEELRDLNQAAKLTMARVQAVTDRESKEKVTSDLGELDERVRLAQKERERLEKEMDGYFVYQPPERTRVYEPNEIPVGSFVTVEDFSTPAEVISVDEKKNSLLISVASMEMTIPIDRVIGVYRERPGAGSFRDRSRVSYQVESVNVPFELDVHGLTVDEALPKVHNYIDDAAKSGIDKVTIVHGRGRGILRDVIRRELAQHPTIRSFESGGYHDGGDGVTIAYLKGQ